MPETENKAPRPPQVPDKPEDTDAPATKNVFEESSKDLMAVAREVAAGNWGEGDVLRERLRAEGFDHREVREAVLKVVRGE